jgi:hypothetical protein
MGERGVVDRSECRVQFKGHEFGEVLPCKYDRRNKTENPFPECSMRREDAQVPAFEGCPIWCGSVTGRNINRQDNNGMSKKRVRFGKKIEGDNRKQRHRARIDWLLEVSGKQV